MESWVVGEEQREEVRRSGASWREGVLTGGSGGWNVRTDKAEGGTRGSRGWGLRESGV